MIKNNPHSRQSLSRLLVVEPDFSQLRPTLDALRQEDFKVTVCSSREAALAHAKHLDFGVVVINLCPACADDAWWLDQIAQLNPHVHVILHTEQLTLTDMTAALNHGAFGWAERGDLDELVEQVHRAFRCHYRTNAKLAVAEEFSTARAERQ